MTERPSVPAPRRRSIPKLRGTRCERWRLRQLTGIPALVDATPVRAHLVRLRAAGLVDRVVAEAAGVDPSTVWLIRTARSTKCWPEVARVLLEVSAHPSVGLAPRPTLGLRRRVQALSAVGWSHHHIAAELGVTVHALRCTLRSDRCPPRRWDAVVEVYERLCMRPGPSDKARQIARVYRWAPPLAWDEDAIDNPHAGPARAGRARRSLVDDIAVQRAIIGDESVTLTRAERRAVVAHAMDAGWTSTRLAERLRCSTDAADQMLVRARNAQNAQIVLAVSA